MSVRSGLAGTHASSAGLFWRRLGLTLAATALVAVGAALAVWWLSPDAPPLAQRNPFGMGLRDGGPTGGIGAYILNVQSGFYRRLQEALSGLKEPGAAIWPLLGIGFSYGVFHAAGPGHGKGVIAAYLVADERALRKGLALSLAAALVQAAVAILLVTVLAIVLRQTAATMNKVSLGVETASFALVSVLGAILAWRKSGKLLGTWLLARDPGADLPGGDCGHFHMPPPESLSRLSRWRDMAAIALAAGIRPCAGALVILVFALSQGMLAEGIAATLAMAMGTALTTGAIASLAVFAKGAALKVAGGRGAGGAIAVAAIELVAAAFVLVLGASLLLGLWASGQAS